MIRSTLIALASLILMPALAAADKPDKVGSAEWEPITEELLKCEKTGFGGLCGVVVDHATGSVWVNLSDRGFCSTDEGKRWKATAEQPSRGAPVARLPAARSHREEQAAGDGARLRLADLRQRRPRQDVDRDERRSATSIRAPRLDRRRHEVPLRAEA